MPAGSIEIRLLRKRFGSPEGSFVDALAGVDLDIMGGSFFVLLGPSGCGKTTLLRCIAGLENPTDGTIHLDGERLDTVAPYARKVTTVFQSYALFPHMTVAQNISFGLEMSGHRRSTAKGRVEEMLNLVQMEGYGSRKPSQLSGGQQQRVALARALAVSPSVLLLDEPLAALDLKLRRGMQVELKRLQRTTGVTFVFVTHDQAEALSMGDRIAVFDRGAIAQVGSPREIYDAPTDRFVADFIGETSFVDVDVRVDGVWVGDMLIDSRVLAEGAAVGGRQTFSLRPERVRVVATANASTLRARVDEVEYRGGDVLLLLDTAGGQKILCRDDPSAGRGPGDELFVEIDEGSMRSVAP